MKSKHKTVPNIYFYPIYYVRSNIATGYIYSHLPLRIVEMSFEDEDGGSEGSHYGCQLYGRGVVVFHVCCEGLRFIPRSRKVGG